MSDRSLPLLLALLALLSGPLVDLIARRVKSAYAVVDGLVLTAIGGTVLVHVVPHTLEAAGLPAAAMVVVGAVAPLALHRGADHDDGWVIVLGSIGLAVHSALDGAALAMSDEALTSAVVLHRVPAGIFIWWLVRPTQGRTRAALVLAAIAVATVIGFVAAQGTPALDGPGIALFEAFVGGMLLHVVLGHGTPGGHSSRTAGAIGALIGLAFVVWLPSEPNHAHDAIDSIFHHLTDDLAGSSWAAALALGVLYASRKIGPQWWGGLAGVGLAAVFLGAAPAGIAALAILVSRHAVPRIGWGRALVDWVGSTTVLACVAGGDLRLAAPSIVVVGVSVLFGIVLPISPVAAPAIGAAVFFTTQSMGAAVAVVVVASIVERRMSLQKIAVGALLAAGVGIAVDYVLPNSTRLPQVDALTFVGITVVTTVALYELFRAGPRGFTRTG